MIQNQKRPFVFAYFEFNTLKALYIVYCFAGNSVRSLESFSERELNRLTENPSKLSKRCSQLMTDRDLENFKLSDPEIPVIVAENYSQFYDFIGYDRKRRKYNG